MESHAGIALSAAEDEEVFPLSDAKQQFSHQTKCLFTINSRVHSVPSYKYLSSEASYQQAGSAVDISQDDGLPPPRLPLPPRRRLHRQESHLQLNRFGLPPPSAKLTVLFSQLHSGGAAPVRPLPRRFQMGRRHCSLPGQLTGFHLESEQPHSVSLSDCSRIAHAEFSKMLKFWIFLDRGRLGRGWQRREHLGHLHQTGGEN